MVDKQQQCVLLLAGAVERGAHRKVPREVEDVARGGAKFPGERFGGDIEHRQREPLAAGGAMCCSGAAAAAASSAAGRRVVRSVSCRSTTSPSAACSAGTSSGPSRRRTVGML